mmetsp:Transcript_52741/g.128818  ORF Transcript_52741/g.128818 Transcript_52741/m.128818 type:complete len:151 (+) Transcript_52741:223-675(+)
MKIFAPNESVGKSRFWYFLKKTHKIKKIKGEIVSIKNIMEPKNNFAKDYGVWIRYESTSGTINMFKEYRDISACGAIEQMYMDMAGRHKAKWSSIIILRIERLKAWECIRPQTKQFKKEFIRFPIIRFKYRNHWDRFLVFPKASRPQNRL